MDQQFIELFDVSKIEVNPDHLPSWPEIQDSWRLWARCHRPRIASRQEEDGQERISDSGMDFVAEQGGQESPGEPNSTKGEDDVKTFPTVDQRVP